MKKVKDTMRQDVLDLFISLTKKLGRFPQRATLVANGLKVSNLNKTFGTIKDLTEYVKEKHPELVELVAPVTIGQIELTNHRVNLIAKESKAENQTVVKSAVMLYEVSRFAESVFKGSIKPIKPVKKKTINRVHTLVLSDLHFGSDLVGNETGSHTYGTIEEARRFAKVIKETCEFKSQYRQNTKLVVLLLGDIIENQMHDARTGDTLSMQCCRAIHLLIQGLAHLSANYPEVEVHCATGNHDRNTARHHGRAIHQKFDSLSTIIYYAVKSALINLKNVSVVIPKTPLAHYEVFGKKIAYTHGDTVLNPGNPYKSINVKHVEHQVNKINAALPDNQEYSVFIYGHVHIGTLVHLANGVTLISNGALPPADHFSVSLGSFETNNGQWIIESVEGHPVGDTRFIKVSTKTDKDKTLDEVIKPWDGNL